jgi:hypothetical protein
LGFYLWKLATKGTKHRRFGGGKRSRRIRNAINLLFQPTMVYERLMETGPAK